MLVHLNQQQLQCCYPDGRLRWFLEASGNFSTNDCFYYKHSFQMMRYTTSLLYAKTTGPLIQRHDFKLYPTAHEPSVIIASLNFSSWISCLYLLILNLISSHLYAINFLSAKRSSDLMLNITCLLPISLQKNHSYFRGIDWQLSGQHLPACPSQARAQAKLGSPCSPNPLSPLPQWCWR